MSRKHTHISKLIKERRKELNLTQVQLAKLCGLKTSQHINGIESGKQGLANFRIKDFADALSLDWEDFVDAKTCDYSLACQDEVLG